MYVNLAFITHGFVTNSMRWLGIVERSAQLFSNNTSNVLSTPQVLHSDDDDVSEKGERVC